MDNNNKIIQSLTNKSNIIGFLVLFIDVSLLVAFFTLSIFVTNIILKVLLLVLVGFKQYSIGESLVHEATHNNLFRSVYLNKIIGPLMSWPFFIVFSIHSKYHLDHHKEYFSKKNNVYEQYERYGLPSDKSKLSRHNLFYVFFLKPIFGLVGLDFFYHNLRELISFKNICLEKILFFIFWGITIYLIVMFNLFEIFLINWFCPVFFIFATLFYYSDIADHYLLEIGNSRNITSRIFNLFIGHNIGYHDLHHRHANIPWFHLKKAANLNCELPKYGYLDFFREVFNECKS